LKLHVDKLPGHLAQGLEPAYLISGDEPLLMMEAGDAVRRAARDDGYSERTVLTVARGFDWHQLASAGASLSLFAERRLIELRLSSAKPGKAGEQALIAFAEDPPPDTLLIVVAPRLDRTAANSRWVKALSAAGVLVQIWPPEPAQLPGWISERLLGRGLQVTREGARLLGDRVEGNLLAAAQEVDKLALLHAPGTALDEEAIRDAVADSARYDVFALADAALGGHRSRALRVLAGLRAEGVEPTLVLWAVTRELRTLSTIAWALATGRSESEAARGVWPKRQRMLIGAARRLSLPGIHRLLRAAGVADQVVKGQRPGQPWPVLTDVVARLSGAVN
jgi:DNA polymerase-3 subunit delta